MEPSPRAQDSTDHLVPQPLDNNVSVCWLFWLQEPDRARKVCLYWSGKAFQRHSRKSQTRF